MNRVIEEDRGTKFVYHHYPKCFIPTLKIFSLSDKVPQQIHSRIIECFSLLFIDYSACLNRIRSCIEILLREHLKQKNPQLSAPKSLFLSIKDFRLNNDKANFESKQFLTALRHIGNAGSHGKSTSYRDALEGLEMLEIIINEIYSNSSKKRILRIVEEINVKQGLLNEEERFAIYKNEKFT